MSRGSHQSGRASTGLSVVWSVRRSPRWSTACELTGFFGAGMVWTRSAGAPGKRGRSHDPLMSYDILDDGWISRFSTTAKPLLEAFGIHHNNRYKIVHTLQRTGSIRRTRSSKNSVEEMVEL